MTARNGIVFLKVISRVADIALAVCYINIAADDKSLNAADAWHQNAAVSSPHDADK